MPIKIFKAEVIQGHKGVLAVLVPFNPEELWKQKPVKLQPTDAAATLAKAIEQSKITTQPKQARKNLA